MLRQPLESRGVNAGAGVSLLRRRPKGESPKGDTHISDPKGRPKGDTHCPDHGRLPRHAQSANGQCGQERPEYSGVGAQTQSANQPQCAQTMIRTTSGNRRLNMKPLSSTVQVGSVNRFHQMWREDAGHGGITVGVPFCFPSGNNSGCPLLPLVGVPFCWSHLLLKSACHGRGWIDRMNRSIST